MPDPVDTLILDLLEWIGPKARPYREVIEAWRTSCPRLPVWEEANERGFIERHHSGGSEAVVSVSTRGAKFLAERRQIIYDKKGDKKGRQKGDASIGLTARLNNRRIP